MRSEAEPARSAVLPIEGVYILHFDKPVMYMHSDTYGDSRHYVGSSPDIIKRLERHRGGRGSNMTKLAVEQGIDITLAVMFPGETLATEHQIQKFGAKHFCPFCQLNRNPPKDRPAPRPRTDPAVREARRQEIRDQVGCPTCKAIIGKPCNSSSWTGNRASNHTARIKAAQQKLIKELSEKYKDED